MAKLLEITGKAISGEWGQDDDTGTGIPVLRTTNFTNEGFVNYKNVVTRSISKKNIAEKYLRHGDVIIEKSGGSDKQPVGRVIFFEGEENKYLFNNFTGLLRVQNPEEWLPKYVFYALYAYYRNGGTRAFENRTTGLHNLQVDNYVKSVDIPKLSYRKQQHICETLDHVRDAVAYRERQLTKLDELIKARFVEMFGDLVENPKQFPCVLLGSIMTVMPQNGLYKPQSAYVQDKFGTPILRIDGFYNGKVTDFNNLKRLCCTDFEKERYLLVENDIVINRVNSIEYLGKCARISGLQEDTVFESNMMRFHLDDSKVNSTYITTVLCSQYIYRQILTRAKKAVNQASINQGDVQSLNVVVPPLSLQNQFADFVAEVDKSKLLAELFAQSTCILAENRSKTTPGGVIIHQL